MPNTNYPRSWKKFIKRSRDPKDNPAVKSISSKNCPILSQWSARFRFAKSFKGLDLGESYQTKDTPLGYASIIRVFLVYSAFETYCKALNRQCGNEDQVKSLQDNSLREATLSEIRKLDPDNKLFKFLASHLNLNNTQIMNNFINGEVASINISFLAKSIRHVFAHGVLTGNAGGLSAKKFLNSFQNFSWNVWIVILRAELNLTTSLILKSLQDDYIDRPNQHLPTSRHFSQPAIDILLAMERD